MLLFFELPLLLLGNTHSLLLCSFLLKCFGLSLGFLLLLSGDFFLGRSLLENVASSLLGLDGGIMHLLLGLFDFLSSAELFVIGLILDEFRHSLVGLGLLTDLLDLVGSCLTNGHHGRLLGLLQISSGLGQSLGFIFSTLLSFLLVLCILSNFSEPGLLLLGLFLGRGECLLPFFGCSALFLLSSLLLSGFGCHFLTDTLGLSLLLRDLLLLQSLLLGKFALLFLEIGELLLLILDRAGLSFQEVHRVVTFSLHVFLELSFLLCLFLLSKCELLLMLLLLFFGNLILEFLLFLLCQLLELS